MKCHFCKYDFVITVSATEEILDTTTNINNIKDKPIHICFKCLGLRCEWWSK